MGNGVDGGLDMVLDTITGIVVLLIVTSIAASLFMSSRRFDKAVIKENQTKASSVYTLAYGNPDYTIDSNNVLMDITNSIKGLKIQINGIPLQAEKVQKLQEKNKDVYNELRVFLGSCKYKKVTSYDANGDIIEINFEGGY